MVPDEPDLLRHVTQLDVRDNRLTELDASVFPRLEVLHCERNRIGSLKAKGCLLKGIYASNNGGFFWTLFSLCGRWCVFVRILSPHTSASPPVLSKTQNTAAKHGCKIKSPSDPVTFILHNSFPRRILVSSLNAFISLKGAALSLSPSIIPLYLVVNTPQSTIFPIRLL